MTLCSQNIHANRTALHSNKKIKFKIPSPHFFTDFLFLRQKHIKILIWKTQSYRPLSCKTPIPLICLSVLKLILLIYKTARRTFFFSFKQQKNLKLDTIIIRICIHKEKREVTDLNCWLYRCKRYSLPTELTSLSLKKTLLNKIIKK